MQGTDKHSFDPVRAVQPATGEADARRRDRSRLTRWRRRHLNTRTALALIALGSLLAPGAAALIEATL